MFSRLLPRLHTASVFVIDYRALRDDGIKALLFDVDNTIVPFTEQDCTPEHDALFASLKEMGFTCCFLSNNANPDRVNRFAARLGTFAVAKARKPFSAGFLKALALTEAAPNETAVIGDQLFTDVYCANRHNALSILVEPVKPGCDEWQVRLKRIPERLLRLLFMRKEG